MATSEPGEDSQRWHSIRPWTPHLSLSVREITSVSATFILSPSQVEELDSSLASLVSDEDEDDQEDIRDPVISNYLGKGLTVKVNGSQWQRFIMRIDEEGEEAIIILYGLMPGRQYDVELSIAAGEDHIRGQVTTEAHALSDRTNIEADLEGGSTKSDILGSTSLKQSVASPPGSSTPPATSSPPRNTITLEERAQQLHHSLNLLNMERDSLTLQLKAARRDAQKADASLRSEIEILKRASEKQANTEHRSRQKVLALQEAVKQTLAAAQEMEAHVQEVEALLPQLQDQSKIIEAEHMKIKTGAKRSKEGMEEVLKADKKRVSDLQSDLTGLTARLDKLKGKKEKLANDTIPDLEQQLSELGREIEAVEKDPYGYRLDESALAIDQGIRYPQQQHPHRGFGRHAPTPIQRPSGSHHGTSQSMSSLHRPPLHNASATHSQPHLTTAPQITIQKRPTAHAQSSGSLLASTLSGRAHPFEPSTRVGNRMISSQLPPLSQPPFESSDGSGARFPRPANPPSTYIGPIRRPGASPPITPATSPITAAGSSHGSTPPWVVSGSSTAVQRVSPSHQTSMPF